MEGEKEGRREGRREGWKKGRMEEGKDGRMERGKERREGTWVKDRKSEVMNQWLSYLQLSVHFQVNDFDFIQLLA